MNADFSSTLGWPCCVRRDPTRRQVLSMLAVAIIATAACYAAHPGCSFAPRAGDASRMLEAIMGAGGTAAATEGRAGAFPMLDRPAAAREELNRQLIEIARGSLPADVRLGEAYTSRRDLRPAAKTGPLCEWGGIGCTLHGQCVDAQGQPRRFVCTILGRPGVAPPGELRAGTVWTCSCTVH